MSEEKTNSITSQDSLQTRLAHPAFPQPPNPKLKVWRYMNLAKFVWLLKHKKLWLTRLDLLHDPHEGTVGQRTAEGIRQFMKNLGREAYWDTVAKVFLTTRYSLYVNCWNWGDNESEAMWRLYSGINDGVAIQTTYGELVKAIEQRANFYIGMVKYIDYERETFEGNLNSFQFAMHKRLVFAHENEVRLVTSSSLSPLPSESNSPLGVTLDWNPVGHVQSVYANPYAPEYHFDALRACVEMLAPGLLDRLQWSRMRALPWGVQSTP